ncbi:MAG: hypothetical protein ACI9C1_004064 [Candidatus Aldehydirespiratoraceae bacterium]
MALHPGVDWSLTGSAVATLLGVEMNPVEDFGVTFINTGEGDYRAEGDSGTTLINYVGVHAADVCE